MDFNNKILWAFELLGIEIHITETIFNTWLIMAFLIILAIIVRIMLFNWKLIPKGLQNAVELAVESFESFVKNSAGEKLMYLGGWFFTIFAFILLSNISGIIGLRPPTADWATTLAFSLATSIIIQIIGIKNRKGKYIKSFFEPVFIFFPLNLIGELARPVSLSFRLFGNILAGLILTSLVYSLLPVYLRLILPVALHIYFDLFTGILQTYIFCVLSLTFIGSAADPTGEG